MTSTNESKDRKPNVQKLENQIFRAMRAEGWVAPESVAEVLEAEKTLDEKHMLVSDASFERARALLRPTGTVRVLHLPKSSVQRIDVSENLARAAREGGVVSPEIEERMRRDRDAAEAESSDK